MDLNYLVLFGMRKKDHREF